MSYMVGDDNLDSLNQPLKYAKTEYLQAECPNCHHVFTIKTEE